MALRHVNVVERLFGLSNRCAAGDAEALAELVLAYHDDARVESHLYGMLSDDRGEAAIRGYYQRVAASCAEWQCMLDYVQDYGDRVLALGALRSAPRHGPEQEDAVGWIFIFRDDKIEAVKAYPSYGDALQAATARSPTASR
ncbi:MAG: nuclear transport factor 2 family protein [Solirubrobacterales bacterium]